MLSKTQFLLAAFVLLTAQVSAHSVVKRKVTGDQLYVLFNRNTCVTVDSTSTCPVSWKLPPEYALFYKHQVNAIPVVNQVLDSLGAGTTCKETFKEILCTQIAPRCLSNGGKYFGNALAHCKKIYTSTCPSRVANAYKSASYCEQNPTGRYEKAECVAPDGHISGACPQPKYKMPADLLKNYKRNSPTRVLTFQTWKNLKYQTTGERVLSPRCLNLMEDFACFALYCSKDEERLLIEHDYEDCEETRQCYLKMLDAIKQLPGGSKNQKTFESLYDSLGDICRTLPRKATANVEDPSKISAADGNGKFSKILVLLFAVYVICSV